MPKQWKTLLLVVIAVGIFFRFFHITQKIYWHDETINSVRMAGYSLQEIYGELPENKPFRVDALKPYQYPSPNRSWLDTIEVLATEEPQNPPLYYLLLRVWLKITGHSIAATRGLSAIFSVLSIGAVYYLARELFGTSGLLAAALVAISPFHVLYAQEARPFSLWTLAVILSGLFLLRAMRTQSWRYWLAYGIATTAGLYTFPFTLFVVMGHGLSVVIHKPWRTADRLICFGLTTAISLGCFGPWLGAIYFNIGRMSSWRYDDTSLVSLVKTWAGNLCRLFFDLNLDASSPLMYVLLPSLAVVGLLIYALYNLWQNASRKEFAFVLLLILVTASALILPDLISGGRRSSISRYFIPTYVGFQLAAAYLFAHRLTAKATSVRRLWGGILLLVLVSGVLSNGVSAGAAVWWTKPLSLDNFAIVEALGSSENPVLVTDRPGWQLLELSHYLPAETQVLIATDQTDLEQLEKKGRSEFLFYPSCQLLDYYRDADSYKTTSLKNLKHQNIFHLERRIVS